METNQNFNYEEAYTKEPSIFRQMVNSITFKLFVVLILALFLLIPMSWVSDLVGERKQREIEVSGEIANKWGSQQVMSGPLIAIPFDYQVQQIKSDHANKEVKVFETQREWIFALPDQLNTDAEVNPEYLNRGIYRTVVYNTKMRIDGKFNKIDLTKVDLKGGTIKWSEAKLVFGISDFKGLLALPKINWGDRQFELGNSDKSFSVFESNLIADLNLEKLEDTGQAFHLDLALRGSRSLNFLPLANQTTIQVKGRWGSPGFNGAFLPEKRAVEDTHFSANWRIPNFSRRLPQQWQGSNQERLYTFTGLNSDTDLTAGRTVDNISATDNDMVQVHFLPDVNDYQKITRVTKYGILVILLTFTSLILVEVIKKQRIHLIQYLLIGIAMVLFYSLLLSISEHTGFDMAYLLSAAATILLVASFVGMLTGKRGIALAFVGILGLFYGFIFFIMQLQDYSLIVGSIGIFIILAILMRFSAKVNWYDLSQGKALNNTIKN